MTLINDTIVLARRPVGEVQEDDFRLDRRDVRPPAPGEVLVRVLWLSLDPYMRGRMNDRKSYAKPVEIGEVMVAEAVGEIVESHTEKFAKGDIVTAYTGWQTYRTGDPHEMRVRKVEPRGLPLSVFLGPAGMPGRTAYFGLNRVGKPKEGETLVVSAASGAVGSVVGQLGKRIGCRVVGVAGGPVKCAYVTGELGFDACIDYKAPDFADALERACPNGIDIYYENVGGAVTRAVAPLLKGGAARVPVCGYVADYNAEDPAKVETPFDILRRLPEPPEHRFFLVSEWDDEHAETTAFLADIVRIGALKYQEMVAEGLENAIAAFRGMLRGENFGKQLVRIAEN